MTKKEKFVRIPTPLKRESINYKSRISISLIALHKKSIEREKRKLGIDEYSLHWIQFLRGALVALLIERLLFN